MDGNYDDIIISTVINLFLPASTNDGGGRRIGIGGGITESPDPRRAQLDLVGLFGEEGSATFFKKELWNLILEADQSPTEITENVARTEKEGTCRKVFCFVES